MMNRGVFGRQMFRYGGHLKMQDGGSVPQGPMPTDQGPMVDPEMAALAEGAMEQGVDPQMVQDELAGYAGQFEQMDQAEDYESAINAIRGDDLPIEDRYAELAELVGPEDAQSTPESVLTLVQPVIQMAEVDQGIGGLAAGQMEDVAVEGPMSQGIMSTVNLGADEEAAPPANFNQGGVVPPVQYYGNGGAAGVNPTDKYYSTPLGGPRRLNPTPNREPDSFRGYMGLEIHPSELNKGQLNNSFSDSRENALFYDAVDRTINPEKQQLSQPEKNDALTTYLGKNLQPRHSIEPVIELPEMDKEKEIEKEIEEKVDKRVKEKEAALNQDPKDATGLKNSLTNADKIIKAATDASGDEDLKKYMKRYKDILMDDESIKKNLKENKDMAKAQMLFGLAEGFFKFGSTPRKGGQSSLGVLMQSMAPAIQNASQQVAVLQAQKQKIEDRQMQIKLAALKAFDQKELAMAKAKASGALSRSDLINTDKYIKELQKQESIKKTVKDALNVDVSKGFGQFQSEGARALDSSSNSLKDSYGQVLDQAGRLFERFAWTMFRDEKSTKKIIEKQKGQLSGDARTEFDQEIKESYKAADKFKQAVKGRIDTLYRHMYKRTNSGSFSSAAYKEWRGKQIDINFGSPKEAFATIDELRRTLLTEYEATKDIIKDHEPFLGDASINKQTLSEIRHLKALRTSLGDLEAMRAGLKPAKLLGGGDDGMESAHGGKKSTVGISDVTRNYFKDQAARNRTELEVLRDYMHPKKPER